MMLLTVEESRPAETILAGSSGLMLPPDYSHKKPCALYLRLIMLVEFAPPYCRSNSPWLPFKCTPTHMPLNFPKKTIKYYSYWN